VFLKNYKPNRIALGSFLRGFSVGKIQSIADIIQVNLE